MSVYEASHSGDGRLALAALRDRLAVEIDGAESAADVARLSARFVEVVNVLGLEAAEVKGRGTVLDELRARRAAGGGR